MTALAARPLGFRVHVLDPEPDCPASGVCDSHVRAEYHDVARVAEFAQGVDVVTFEFENVPAEALQAIEAARPVRPASAVLKTCRNRVLEKTFLSSSGFPVAPFRVIRSSSEVGPAAAELGFPCILKTAELGYDGRGQVRIDDPGACAASLAKLGAAEAVLEGFVRFDHELSVICARREDGECRCFPVFCNVHRNHILDITTVPASFGSRLEHEAVELATEVANRLGVVGLITVEMFLCGERLVVNELAPRPHNSGHVTIDACVTSQFEQHVRAICGLPLGSPRLRCGGAAMVNLLGDLWAGGSPAWDRALSDPDVRLHLYGKREARPGRKMGHLTVCAADPATAMSKATQARGGVA
jgi:5-(carboxyamino)imidazole ribonucleotide synthase